MKLRLPGKGKRKGAPRRTPAGGKASLERAWGGAFVAAAVVLGLLAAGLFQQISYQWAEAQRAQVETLTAEYVAQLAETMRQHTVNMGFVANDPEIVRLLGAGDEQALREREVALSRLFPESLKVRLLPPRVESPNRDTKPPLGYACLDLLRQARNGKAPPAEAHMHGTPDQHVDIVRVIAAPDGSAAGNLMVTLAVSSVQQAVDRLRLDGGYVELQQVTPKGSTLNLATRGSRPAGHIGPAKVQPIEGTRWRLAYWPVQAVGAFDTTDHLYYWGGFGAALAVLGLMLFVLYRGVARALREDQVTVIRLFKDLEEGGVTRRYSARLTNCRGALEQLQHMARDFRGAPAAAPPLEAAPAGLGPDTGGLEVREAPQTKTIPASIFRAYDIRGIVGDTLTADIVYDIGRAIGSEACEKGQQKIVVGRDGRLSGPELSAALIKGLTAVGCDVADVGQVPTPVLYFATEYLGTGSGAMLTGSHNPANYNGLKIMLRGETLYGDGIQALRSRVQSANLTSGEGSAQSVDVAMSYIDRITSDVRLARPLKVAVDCGNGVTGELAPQLLRALGCEVVELYCEVDGTFPNHHPDPGKPENLIALTRAVTGQGADIGVAFDGDGDRIGVVDSGGKIIWPDRLLMLLAQDLLLRQPGAQIIYDVKSSRHLEQVIQSHGGQPLMWKTGHSLIKAKMRETGALLAGEMSGHIFFKERWFGFDDALYACARLLEVVSADERPSAKLFAELPESVSTPELNVGTAEGQHFKIMEQLVTDPGFPGAKLITIDGLRVEFEDGWGLVRASNTTPSLVLRFEADDAEALRRIQDAFRARLQRIDPGLDLQF